MLKNYRATIRASFVGYVVQAMVNLFAPLLFVTFQNQYGIPLTQITALITVNFSLQLCVDLFSAVLVERIGYRVSVILAHTFAALGMIGLTVLPEVFPTPFSGLLCAVVLYAVGGGLLEVIISPIVEACPNEHKARTMSVLHSFYCWGSVGVIVLSTLYFRIFGIENWKYMALLWALLPITNGIIFSQVPLRTLIPEGERKLSIPELLRTKLFWIFAVVILCAGAAEQAVSQWASAFTEKGLGISKSMSDLVGPTLFSVFMGLSRMLYGRCLERIRLQHMMLGSTILCIISYLMIGLSPYPALSLAGIMLAGFSVGILWPGTYSQASEALPAGGNAMFALLALGGDLGCAGGPTFAGLVAGAAGDSLRIGILAAVWFPALLAILLLTRRSA